MTGVKYSVYPLRFGIATVFSLGNLLNAAMWICFAPVENFTQARFGVGPFAVNMLSLVFMILYLPGSVLSVFLMERYGMRATLIVGAVLNTLCALVRWLGAAYITDPAVSFGVVMLGQIIGGIAQPIFSNLPSRISGDWFAVTERDLSTTACAMSNPLGNAVGSGEQLAGGGAGGWGTRGADVVRAMFLSLRPTAGSAVLRLNTPTPPSTDYCYGRTPPNACGVRPRPDPPVTPLIPRVRPAPRGTPQRERL
jgi:MFS family permease